MPKLGTQYTLESWLIANGKPGDVLYSDKKDKDITAIAAQYNRKVVTERCLLIMDVKSDFPITRKITRVTVI